MGKKKPRYRKKKQAPPRRFPWLWLLAGGGVLLVVAGVMGLFWNSSSTAGPVVPVEVSGSPRLRVEQDVIDEGYNKLDKTIRTTFRLQNVGDQPLRILGEPQVELVEGC